MQPTLFVPQQHVAPARTASFRSWWLTLQAHRLAPLVAIGASYLLVSFMLRLVLVAVFGLNDGMRPILLVPTILLGLINDSITLSYLLAPIYLFLTFIPIRIYQSLVGRVMIVAMGWISFFVIPYIAVIQYYFFKEFSSRFNLVSVDYLIYPHEVFVNIYQTHHVVSTFFIVFAYATILMFFCWKLFTPVASVPVPMKQRLRSTLLYSLAIVAFSSIFSTHSLDFSSNRLVNEIAADGISSFFEALHTNNLDYTAYYRTGDERSLSRLLAGTLARDTSRSQPAPSTFNRVAAGNPQGLGKLNVVVIVEESLGCEHVDTCKRGLDIDAAVASAAALTPNLDRLARQGLFFNRAYATGTRTVRGLEAITTSFPPIPSESIIKRPGSDHIASWGKVMREQGYQTSFLYGGYSLFDNMGEFYGSNDFAVKDRNDIDNPRFGNIWGVSDQDLFAFAKRYFDAASAANAPFFSIIMTTSNHSPFTFPDGIEGVRAKGGNRYDGVRYADYALGEFFRQIESAPWYRQTLFVVVADHGARIYGSEKIPLPSYEIPLLIMAPGRLAPRQIVTPASQMDIAPTVMGLLGLPYSAPFFGQDVLAEGNDTAKVLLFNHNHDVALYQNGRLAVLGLRDAAHTYTYRLGDDSMREIPRDEAMVDLATAYYQTAYNLFVRRQYL
ncbi:LTA synthase family protein [Desulfobulbus sp.]|uniref:LTA synthase family protein n=1 Tax=Desulfobulbus sp. TaxID=895 RepID=UPI00286F7DD2|nr:LTA synthase family protein [Desulfobulbus sp.]